MNLGTPRRHDAGRDAGHRCTDATRLLIGYARLRAVPERLRAADVDDGGQMAKIYRRTAATRATNGVFTVLTRFGLGASYRHLLTVRGRKTGQLRTNPVDVMDTDGQRWLVAGYGPANWVRNARAAGEVTLSRGRHRARYTIAEPAPGEAIRVLRQYMTDIRVTRPYFDATSASPDSDVEAELPRHPVLRLIPKA